MKKLHFIAALVVATITAKSQTDYQSPYYVEPVKQSWQPSTTDWQNPNLNTWQPQSNQSTGYDTYNYNQYGTPQKTGYTEKNSNGGYDVYKYNSYGMPVKVESVEPRK